MVYDNARVAKVPVPFLVHIGTIAELFVIKTETDAVCCEKAGAPGP